MKDPLDERVREALDALHPPPALAHRIQATVNRRRRLRLIGMVAAALLIVATVTTVPRRPIPPKEPPSVARTPDFSIDLPETPPEPVQLEEVTFTATVQASSDSLVLVFKE